MLVVQEAVTLYLVKHMVQYQELVQNWRLATDKNTSADEYGMILNQLFQYEKRQRAI